MRRLLISLAAMYRGFVRFILKMQGHTFASHASKRIVNGKTWDDFCDTLKASGANILRHASTTDERTQAEGYRYLSRLTRAGLEAFVEYADPSSPALRRMVHETVKMGADNPDNHYLNAVISGAHEYRITGTRGTVHFLCFSTQKGGYGQGGGMPPTGFLDSTKLAVNDDGSMQIEVSTTPKDGNWLPMTPETGLLIVRQTFLDRSAETPAVLHIERADKSGPIAPPDPLSVDKGLMTAANFVAGASFLFSSWATDFQQHTNLLPRFDPDKSTAAGGDPDIAYYHSYWRLGPKEALVIEFTPPECEHWNFQLNNHWMESLDYRYHTIHVNRHTAVVEPDGSVRIVAAHEALDVPNLLSTTGLTAGTMCLRWIRAKEHPTPKVRVVLLDAFSRELEGRSSRDGFTD
jgi:hypothetical protein